MNVPAACPTAQLKLPLAIAHGPLLLVNVNPLHRCGRVCGARPADIPFAVANQATLGSARGGNYIEVAFTGEGVPGLPVGWDPPLVVVVGGLGGLPDLGR